MLLACERRWKSASRVYLTGREAVMRMSTSLRTLCCQSGPDATFETPIGARSRSNVIRHNREQTFRQAGSVPIWRAPQKPVCG
jgi:hypothetical protein